MNAPDPSRTLALARDVLRTEADAIVGLIDRLDDAFVAAVGTILNASGRVVVSGIGKSGHIGRKLAATLASTGTPAFFVHPAEAVHGDLGMITKDDVFIALSNSGEASELLIIVPLVKRLGGHVIAITGNEKSSLAQSAHIHLDAFVPSEACPLGLAPSASTTATLALGDALALALLDARGFTAEDFARSHPGGALGRRLLTHVRDVMRSGDRIPKVPVTATLVDAMEEISAKMLGMTVVVDATGKVLGIFTDGDLRRGMLRHGDLRNALVADHMTRSPKSIQPQVLAAEAVAVMEQSKITALLVQDDAGQLVGVLHMHDLFQAKVV